MGKGRRTPSLCSAYAAGSTVPVLELVAKELEWALLEKADPNAGVYWVCQKDRVNQLVKDLPYNQLIARYPKMGLFCNKQVAVAFPGDFDFWPQSYMMPGDEEELKAEMAESSKRDFFIVKPDEGSQGDGIFLTNSWTEMVSRLGGLPVAKQWVAQRYIARPYLLDGMKFDLRLYVLLTSTGGCYRSFLCREGLVRLCTETYKPPTNASKHNVNSHLTNYSLNKHSDGFVRGEEEDVTGGSGSKRSLSSVLDVLRSKGEDVETLWQELKALVGNTVAALHAPLMEACNKHQNDGSNLFQVLGFDVLLDADLRPILLEVNNQPSMSIGTPVPVETNQEEEGGEEEGEEGEEEGVDEHGLRPGPLRKPLVLSGPFVSITGDRKSDKQNSSDDSDGSESSSTDSSRGRSRSRRSKGRRTRAGSRKSTGRKKSEASSRGKSTDRRKNTASRGKSAGAQEKASSGAIRRNRTFADVRERLSTPQWAKSMLSSEEGITQELVRKSFKLRVDSPEPFYLPALPMLPGNVVGSDNGTFPPPTPDASLGPLRPISSPGHSGRSSQMAPEDLEQQEGQLSLSPLSMSLPFRQRLVTGDRTLTSPGSLSTRDLPTPVVPTWPRPDSAGEGEALPLRPAEDTPLLSDANSPSLQPIRLPLQTRFSAAVLQTLSSDSPKNPTRLDRSQSLIPTRVLRSSKLPIVAPQTALWKSPAQQGPSYQTVGSFTGQALMTSGQQLNLCGTAPDRSREGGQRMRLQPLGPLAAALPSARPLQNSDRMLLVDSSGEAILLGSSFGLRTEAPKRVPPLIRRPTAPSSLRSSRGSVSEGHAKPLPTVSGGADPSSNDVEGPGRPRPKTGNAELNKTQDTSSTPMLARQLSQKRPWGAPSMSSKRPAYVPPPTALPSAPLRPNSSWERSMSDSSTGTSTSSRLVSFQAKGDNVCHCKEHHLPHRHIISPVDQHVKLETLSGALSIVHNLSRGEDPLVSDTEYEECRPSLLGDEPVEDHNGALLCCSSLLLNAQEIYMACSSMKADGNTKIRQVEQFKLRRWAESAGLLTPLGALKPVDLDIVFRQWKIKFSVLQKVGSKFVLFLDLLYQLCERGMPGVALSQAFNETVGLFSAE